MDHERDQVWDSEESTWICRNIERNLCIDFALKIDGEILEIGPGHGRLMKTLSDAGKNVMGLEISDNLIQKLNNKGLKVQKGNILNIPFKNDSFSAVILEEVIEHIKDQDQAMKEIKRVLKPGGHLLLTTPNKWIYRFLMYLSNIKNNIWKVELLKNPTPGHVSECNLSKIKKLHQGLKILEIVPINPYIPDAFLRKVPRLAINYLVYSVKNI